MIDNDLLINLHRTLVIIRSNIERPVNIRMLQCGVKAVSEKFSNKQFLEYCSSFFHADIEFYNVINENFIKENKIPVELNKQDEQLVHDVLILAFNKIIELLSNKNYEDAYDVVDAFHVFPEIMVKESKRDLKSYWNIYIKKLKHREYFEEIKTLFIESEDSFVNKIISNCKILFKKFIF